MQIAIGLYRGLWCETFCQQNKPIKSSSSQRGGSVRVCVCVWNILVSQAQQQYRKPRDHVTNHPSHQKRPLSVRINGIESDLQYASASWPPPPPFLFCLDHISVERAGNHHQLANGNSSSSSSNSSRGGRYSRERRRLDGTDADSVWWKVDFLKLTVVLKYFKTEVWFQLLCLDRFS